MDDETAGRDSASRMSEPEPLCLLALRDGDDFSGVNLVDVSLSRKGVVMLGEATVPDWVYVVERLGIATIILLFVGRMVWIMFKTFLPLWKRRIEANIQLTQTLTGELPKIASNTESVAKTTSKVADTIKDVLEMTKNRFDLSDKMLVELKKTIDQQSEAN